MINIKTIEVGDVIIGRRTNRIWMIIGKKTGNILDIYCLAENRYSMLQGVSDFVLFDLME